MVYRVLSKLPLENEGNVGEQNVLFHLHSGLDIKTLKGIQPSRPIHTEVMNRKIDPIFIMVSNGPTKESHFTVIQRHIKQFSFF